MRALRIGPIAFVTLTLSFLELVAPASLSAQAWLPGKGWGDVSIAYKHFYVRDHLDMTGSRQNKGQIRSHVMSLDLAYGITRRLAVNVGVPLSTLKYTGNFPHKDPGELQYIDDGKYHGGFQDFRFGLRYSLVRYSPVVITPFIDGIVPSHNYETFAHAALGRNLREVLIGTNVGWKGGEESFLSNVYTQTRFSYGFVERVLDRSHNRTNIDSELGYFLTPRLALSGLASFQKHHGNPLDRDFSKGPEQWTEEEEHDHMGLLRADQLDVGAGVAFRLNARTSLFATALHTVWGRNGHPIQAGLIVGINWRFRTRSPNISADDALPPESLNTVQERR
jgi:hypothetical protein